jgi:multicomponent Na+:H+ antiporter subunit D
MHWLIVLPVGVPLTAAMLCFVLRGRPLMERTVSLGGAVLLFAAAAALFAVTWSERILVEQIGRWPAPAGITLVADLLAAVMVLITGITGLLIAVYACADIDDGRERAGFHAFYHVLLAGICGAFLAGDLFNLYVWFEVMLIASFVLLSLGGEKAQLDGAIKYLAINLVSTILFLSATGLLYGLTGTLNMADLSRLLPLIDTVGLVDAIAVLFIVAFGIKAAVFPLFFWLPASYHTPPVPVTAIFAAMLTKVGVYALVRMFTLVFTQDVGYTHGMLLAIAVLTMITGVLGAAAQNDIRRILSFHIISQIGYMILGLALYAPLAIAGTVFYLLHHIIVKANLFLIAGVAKRATGSFDLGQMGGLYRSHPWLAVLFLIPAFSLAGFPPLSGFWAKLILVKASLDTGAYVAAAAALVVGLLTVFSMTKIWTYAFWKPLPAEAAAAPSLPPGQRAPVRLIAPIVTMAALTVLIGLWPEPFVIFAERAAAQLLDPAGYVAAVLGGRR